MIITFKNNKGGVGKSWLTFNIGHGLANIGARVLIITSDSQNNVLDFSGVDVEAGAGLENWVKKGEGDIIRLREDLYYIPLENNNFTTGFRNKVKDVIRNFQKDYDYILIDSVPTLLVDNEFQEVSDKIVIPAYMDDVSLKGIVELVNSVDKKKILGIIPNRYNNSPKEREILEELEIIMDKHKVKLFKPVRQLSFITTLIHNKKSIWETSSTKIENITSIMADILKEIIKCKKERS